MLKKTIQEELKSKIRIENDSKVIYQAKGVINEGQGYFNSPAVVIVYELINLYSFQITTLKILIVIRLP